MIIFVRADIILGNAFIGVVHDHLLVSIQFQTIGKFVLSFIQLHSHHSESPYTFHHKILIQNIHTNIYDIIFFILMKYTIKLLLLYPKHKKNQKKSDFL